ncbi:MAG: hypothetical protein K9J06_08215 [Flavobacteriales bacterium]|nr:hypothetical protein [Flavobacteriales bacterium]
MQRLYVGIAVAVETLRATSLRGHGGGGRDVACNVSTWASGWPPNTGGITLYIGRMPKSPQASSGPCGGGAW